MRAHIAINRTKSSVAISSTYVHFTKVHNKCHVVYRTVWLTTFTYDQMYGVFGQILSYD